MQHAIINLIYLAKLKLNIHLIINVLINIYKNKKEEIGREIYIILYNT